MSAVLCSTEHPAELGPLVVFRILHEGRDGVVNADESFSAFDEAEQRRPQLRIVEQHTHGVVEADGVELFDVRRPEHLDIVVEDGLIGARHLSHLLDGVVPYRDGAGGTSARRLAIPHRQIGDEHPAWLLGLGRCLARNRCVHACLLLGLDLLPLKGCAAQRDDQADPGDQKSVEHSLPLANSQSNCQLPDLSRSFMILEWRLGVGS